MAVLLGAALLVAAPLLGGCAFDDDGAAGSGPRVVASFYPLQYVAQRIDRADVASLTSPGTEPHDLELTVRQTIDVEEADVVVYSAGLQPAVDDAVDQADPPHVVDAAAVADLHTPEELGEHAADAEHAEDGHDHGDLDPHFWLDPVRLADVAGAVEQQLAAADPDHAGVYERNLTDLRRDLDDLDAQIADGLSDCARDTIVVSHDAFSYFAARYGLHVEAINGLSPDAEPSPAHLSELATLIRDRGITTVFAETLASPEMADTLAGELGLHTAILDPVEGLSDETADADYLSLMRANLSAIQEANDCS
jgi:zinc transport system substrate-binding protein